MSGILEQYITFRFYLEIIGTAVGVVFLLIYLLAAVLRKM